ncbi:MAG TPA: SDR family oxidoreductase [bacterium]|nr:SDR family oxidoreductase [bacterium]HMW35051.1 SDR family oxidoreductase [bacterium]HMZ05767.1 SDR family oxidoreductase [bacterium]HNC49166.1 SDR family oxidoreductase [bacterium]HND77995.1 SDR family oxidoreductase [bacterium]
MSNSIFIAGATGTTASQLLKHLATLGVKVKAGVRDIKKAETLASEYVAPVHIDYTLPSSIENALRGVKQLFMLTPFTDESVTMGKRIVDAAKKAGVQYIVKLSAAGADAEPGITLVRWHREVEKYIEASGIPYTHLRPNSFMQNFINFFPPQNDVIYLPLGEGKVSWVDVRDIAAVAAHVLTHSGHAGKAYTITGPDALSVTEVSKILSEATGKTISYTDVPEEAARKTMVEMQMPNWAIDGLLELHAINKAGYAAEISNVTRDMTGKDPIDFERFAKDNAARF